MIIVPRDTPGVRQSIRRAAVHESMQSVPVQYNGEALERIEPHGQLKELLDLNHLQLRQHGQ